MVRLKVVYEHELEEDGRFQFLMVRLKDRHYIRKSWTGRDFNSLWCD